MVEVKVCVGSSCHMKGSYQVIKTFEELIKKNDLKDEVALKASFCMGQCQNDVSVDVDGKIYSVSPETAHEFFEETIMAAV